MINISKHKIIKNFFNAHSRQLSDKEINLSDNYEILKKDFQFSLSIEVDNFQIKLIHHGLLIYAFIGVKIEDISRKTFEGNDLLRPPLGNQGSIWLRIESMLGVSHDCSVFTA